jgi:hypothetical protein
VKKLVASAAFLAAVLVPFAAIADDGKSNKSQPSDQFTLALFGHWPYNAGFQLGKRGLLQRPAAQLPVR